MQSTIAVGAFLALKLCNSSLYQSYIFLSWLLWPLGLSSFLRREVLISRIHSLQMSLQRYIPALQSATVEFHKAQCFFMLAFSIAAQSIHNRGTLNEGITTLQGVYNNYTFVGIISLSGLLPISMTLLSLHSIGLRS